MNEHRPGDTPEAIGTGGAAHATGDDARVRYVSAGVPGVGGWIKERCEDFLVEEIPQYEPCGEGEHIYLLVEKTNLSTLDLVRRVADHFGVRRDAVGFAGLKDRVAVTRQVLSVHTPGKKPGDFPSLESKGIVVHWADLHTNKLRRGHLRGNRFVIRVRGVDPGKVVYAAKTLRMLGAKGSPNRIGEQRFGVMGRNHLIGRALIRRDAAGVVEAMLAPAAEGAWGPESQREARRFYVEGKYQEALERMPYGMRAERRVLEVLARGSTAKAAVRRIERSEQSFFFTAFQSAIFNRVLDERMDAGTFGTIAAGDIVFKHDSGAVFGVSDAMMASEEERGVLNERAERFEISPTGPMWGDGMMMAGGATGECERRALEASGVTTDELARIARTGLAGVEGTRRSFRVPVMYPDVESGVDEHGAYIKCTFELPRGAFATSVMTEIMKPGPGEGLLRREAGAEKSAEPEEDEGER